MFSGVATGVRGVRAAPGGTCYGRQRGEKRRKFRKKNSCENSDCKFHMCLRARKTKRYVQRVPIVSYTNVTVDIT